MHMSYGIKQDINCRFEQNALMWMPNDYCMIRFYLVEYKNINTEHKKKNPQTIDNSVSGISLINEFVSTIYSLREETLAFIFAITVSHLSLIHI